MITFQVDKENDQRNLFQLLKNKYKSIPVSVLEKTLRNKDVKINGKSIKDKKTIVFEGDLIVVFNLNVEEKSRNIIKVKKQFNVLFEDENILVIEKPEGISMHDERNSIDNQVQSYLNLSLASSIGRLDKSTSGLIIYGKKNKVIEELNKKNSYFNKEYIFESDFNKESLEVKVNLIHDENLKREIVVKHGGKIAKTIFRIEKNKKIAKLLTGRKHQIRATLSHLGFPILGDRKYGGKAAKRVFLHCFKIELLSLEGELAYLNNKIFLSYPKW